MKRVLVTGAAGFIGRHAVPQLLACGYEVHAVDVRPVPVPGAILHTADLSQAAEQRALLEQVRPSHLLHFAWYVTPGGFWTSLENVRWVQTSLNLLLHFAESGGTRWVGAGTCAEYAWSPNVVCREGQTPLQPATLYGTCKNALQSIQSHAARQLGISAAWGRVFHLYGPYEPRNRLVPSVTCSLLQGEPAPCSHGRQVRDFLHVQDVARAFVTLLESGWDGPLNIASGIPVSIRQIVELIAEVIGRTDLLRIGSLPAAGDEPERLIADSTNLRSLGFSPRYSLEEGVRNTVAFWRSALPAKQAVSNS